MFTRIARFFKAIFHAIIGEAEAQVPVQMLEQANREMLENLRSLREATATTIAFETQAKRELEAQNGRVKNLERRPDVVVTDVIMPNMDGAEMLEELRRRVETRDVPVIALTALTDKRTQARMASLGVVGFLAKPYSLRDLALQIEKATGPR